MGYMNRVTIEKTPQYLIVKIPLKAVEEGRAELSPRSRRVIDKAVSEGLADIEAGRVFGPFSDVKNFKAALRTASRK